MAHSSRARVRPEDARRSNVALVLQAIYDTPGLSRADLARSTGLTKVTVSDLVAELIDAGLVDGSRLSDEARPGKPSNLLTFLPDARDVLALDLSSADVARGAVISMGGAIVRRVQRPLDGAVGEDAVGVALDLARDLASSATRPILGLGVASPGIVDADGRVVRAPNLRWRELALGERLEAELGVGVHVENDANAAAAAEARFGGGPGNLVRVQLSRGVGAGLMLDGQLVHGPAFDAGEIGHVVIDATGDLCACGKKGCLEIWTSEPALRRRIAETSGGPDPVLAQAGRRLARALAPVVGMLGVSYIVVGGPSDLVTPAMLDATRDLIVDLTRSEFRPALTVVASSLNEDAALLGAAALVLSSRLGVR